MGGDDIMPTDAGDRNIEAVDATGKIHRLNALEYRVGYCPACGVRVVGRYEKAKVAGRFQAAPNQRAMLKRNR